jgi:hypothetical protein
VADPVILLSFLRCVLVINRSRWLASRERRYNDLTQLGSLRMLIAAGSVPARTRSSIHPPSS